MEYLQYCESNDFTDNDTFFVLNLIINGIPSIHLAVCFKLNSRPKEVLNLIINGIPSIL